MVRPHCFFECATCTIWNESKSPEKKEKRENGLKREKKIKSPEYDWKAPLSSIFAFVLSLVPFEIEGDNFEFKYQKSLISFALRINAPAAIFSPLSVSHQRPPNHTRQHTQSWVWLIALRHKHKYEMISQNVYRTRSRATTKS